MKLAIIDYGSGNLHSAAKAFEKESGKGKVVVTSNAKDLDDATHIVLPGVGAFYDCMTGLLEVKDMFSSLEENVLGKKKPFLGICVGMQLLADKGLEHGENKGFGWIKGKVTPIKPRNKSLKIPHMGWNELKIKGKHPLFDGIKDGDHAYFVHSYHMECKDGGDIKAEADYGGSITAAVANGNIMGVQFHPEKSQETGLKLINNFMKI